MRHSRLAYPAPCFNTDGRRQTCSKTVSRQFVPAQYWRNRAIKWKLTITIYFNILGDNYIVGDGATSGYGLLIVISRDGVNPALLLLKVVGDFLTSLTDLLLMIIMDIVVIFLQAGRNWKILTIKKGHDASQQLTIIFSSNLYSCFV